VLACHAELAIKIPSSREFLDDRRQLYRFRACPKNKQKPHRTP
jgi:hypothetical protein